MTKLNAIYVRLDELKWKSVVQMFAICVSVFIDKYTYQIWSGAGCRHRQSAVNRDVQRH